MYHNLIDQRQNYFAVSEVQPSKTLLKQAQDHVRSLHICKIKQVGCFNLKWLRFLFLLPPPSHFLPYQVTLEWLRTFLEYVGKGKLICRIGLMRCICVLCSYFHL